MAFNSPSSPPLPYAPLAPNAPPMFGFSQSPGQKPQAKSQFQSFLGTGAMPSGTQAGGSGLKTMLGS